MDKIAYVQLSVMVNCPRAGIAYGRIEVSNLLSIGQYHVLHVRLSLSSACISQDPSTKRRHPRGYLESLERHNTSLEQHVAFLEETLHQIQPEIDIDSFTSAKRGNGLSTDSNVNRLGVKAVANPSVHLQLPPVSLPTVLTQQPRRPSNASPSSSDGLRAAPDDLSSLELLCLRSAGGEPHYFGASSAYSFTKLFSATLRAFRTQAPGLSMAGVTDSAVQSRPRATPLPLPDRTVTSMLSTAYFEQVHPQFPFLHHPTYLEWEENVMTAYEQGLPPRPTELFFVYAVSQMKSLKRRCADSE